MEVKILGTGSIYSKRNCASIIIDKKILFDVGPGILKQLLNEKYNLSQIDTILISHLHSDHILDFAPLIVNLNVLNIKHKIKIIGPLYLKQKLTDFLNLMYGNYYNKFIDTYLEFIEIKDEEYELYLGNYKINMIKVNHYDIEAYGFVINNKLGLTGDSSMCDGIKNIYNNCKIMIADCSVLIGDIYHLGFNNIKKLLESSIEKTIIATHLRDDTRNSLKNSKINNFKLVEDGYEFKL